MVDGLIRLMNSPREVTGPINLGNPGEFTILELAKKVPALVGNDCPIEHRPLPTIQRGASPTSARPAKCSDGKPTIPLEEGLKRTVDYFRSTLAS